MRLNTLSPAVGAKKERVRVGRGRGSGLGKTCGKGHKGQKARAGGNVKAGFEGGQMPLQRRLPKVGFISAAKKLADEIRLHELEKVDGAVIDLAALKAAGLVSGKVARVSIIEAGGIAKAVVVRGVRVTAGAKRAIEAAGGKVE